MKTYFSLTAALFISGSALASETCRVAIHDMDLLMGQNNFLIEQVHQKLEKKNISLIHESELLPGDFHISDFVAVYNGKPNIPIHEYKFKTKKKIGLTNCVAVPLCSPVYVDSEVTDITGIKYKHDYSVKLVTDSKPKKIIYARFSHSYRDELVSWSSTGIYDGSSEQEDLANAIADEIPKCAKLLKAKGN